MPLTISLEAVRSKCGLADTDFDSLILALIAEQRPAIEEMIRPDAMSGSLVVLNLGATEIVAGEFLAQLCRQPGWSDQIVVQGLAIHPYVGRDPLDPFGLKAQGWGRLRGYLRVDPTVGVAASVLRGGDKGLPEEDR